MARGTEEDRTFFRGNTVPMVGLRIIKQSTANTIDVARSIKAEVLRLNPNLPEGMGIKQSYDTSVFVEGVINQYMEEYMNEIERRLMPFVDSGEATRLLVRARRTFTNFANFNSGIVVFVLNDWSLRRPAWAIMEEVRNQLAGLPGVRTFPVMRQGFGASIQKPCSLSLVGCKKNRCRSMSGQTWYNCIPVATIS